MKTPSPAPNRPAKIKQAKPASIEADTDSGELPPPDADEAPESEETSDLPPSFPSKIPAATLASSADDLVKVMALVRCDAPPLIGDWSPSDLPREKPVEAQAVFTAPRHHAERLAETKRFVMLEG